MLAASTCQGPWHCLPYKMVLQLCSTSTCRRPRQIDDNLCFQPAPPATVARSRLRLPARFPFDVTRPLLSGCTVRTHAGIQHFHTTASHLRSTCYSSLQSSKHIRLRRSVL